MFIYIFYFFVFEIIVRTTPFPKCCDLQLFNKNFYNTDSRLKNYVRLTIHSRRVFQLGLFRNSIKLINEYMQSTAHKRTITTNSFTGKSITNHLQKLYRDKNFPEKKTIKNKNERKKGKLPRQTTALNDVP